MQLMKKQLQNQNQETPSSRNAMIVMAIGVIAIAALVGWALTRQVEPGIEAPVTQTPASQPPVVDTSTFTATPSSTASAAPISDEDSVPRIGVTELKAKLERREVTVIDVRDDNAFRMGHIAGSLHIPFARIEGEARTLPRNKPIVTVCT
jgi:hypothetical protein